MSPDATARILAALAQKAADRAREERLDAESRRVRRAS